MRVEQQIAALASPGVPDEPDPDRTIASLELFILTGERGDVHAVGRAVDPALRNPEVIPHRSARPAGVGNHQIGERVHLPLPGDDRRERGGREAEIDDVLHGGGVDLDDQPHVVTREFAEYARHLVLGHHLHDIEVVERERASNPSADDR